MSTMERTEELVEVSTDFGPIEDTGVFVLNNDVTPVDFVVDFISSFFKMDEEKAAEIAQTANKDGECLCMVYPKDIAVEVVKVINKLMLHSPHYLEFKAKELK